MSNAYPLDTGRILNVHKTLRKQKAIINTIPSSVRLFDNKVLYCKCRMHTPWTQDVY